MRLRIQVKNTSGRNPQAPDTFDPVGRVVFDNLKMEPGSEEQSVPTNGAGFDRITAASPAIHCSTKERRVESRIAADAPAVMIPLASVTSRISSRILNVSRRGVKVRTAEPLKEPPRTGDAYRILSGDDVMLCEVRYYHLAAPGAEVGFKILHRFSTGELSQLMQAQELNPKL